MAILSFSEVERSDVRSCYRAVVGMSTHALSTDEYRKVHHLLAQVWTTGTTVHDPDEITLVGDVCHIALLNLADHNANIEGGWLPYTTVEHGTIILHFLDSIQTVLQVEEKSNGICTYTRF